MKKSWMLSILGISSFLWVNDVEASPNTAITNIETHDEYADVDLEFDGDLELPNGNVLYENIESTASYSVSRNGAYTFISYEEFRAVYGGTHIFDTDTALIDSIDRGLFATNQDTVEITVSGQDNQSGIYEYRLRNELNGTWSDWIRADSVGTVVEETLDWEIDTSEEGVRRVYAQFRDQAGNVTEEPTSDLANTSDDAPFAEVIYSTTPPDFTLGSHYYFNENVITIDVHSVTSEWSTPENFILEYNGQERLFAIDETFDFISFELDAGQEEGEIPLYISSEDAIGNRSEPIEYNIMYDETSPESSISVDNMRDSWTYNTGTQSVQSINIIDEENADLTINVSDVLSGMNRDVERDGMAEFTVREFTRNSTNDDWSLSESRTYDTEGVNHSVLINSSGDTSIQWNLKHGLETYFDIVATDNAGNESTVSESEIFRQSNMQLLSFNIVDVVNPEFDGELPSPTAEFSAGGDVTFEMVFNLESVAEYESLEGEVRFSVGGTTEEIEPIQLTEDNLLDGSRYVETFVVPEEMPIGSTVLMQGELTAVMPDGIEHTIFFPHDNPGVHQEIGTIQNSLEDFLHFNISR